MNIIETIKDNFNKGYFNKAMIINGLPINYPAWTIKGDSWVSVAVPLNTDVIFDEHFAEVRIHTSLNTYIDNKKYNLLMLTCCELELRNEFAVICSQFVTPGINGVEREELISNPRTWWSNWKFLLGNVNSSKSAYPILGELLLLEKLYKEDKSAKWTGANKATHDIELSDRSYEVKSTTNRYGYEVTISNIYQLQNYKKSLELVFCRFELSSLGISIDETVDKLVSMGYPENDLEKMLKNNDLTKGCTARTVKFKILEMKSYLVNDQFPAITEKSFINGTIPKHIVRYSYTIDLSGINNKNII